MKSAGEKHKKRRFNWHSLAPIPWLAPVLILLLGVVMYPMIEMIRTAFLKISRSGLSQGFNGIKNFRSLFALPDLSHIALQTILWVVAVVVLTLIVSWPVALLLSKDFFGRTLVRYAVIVPWAASLVMTSLVFKWMFNYYYGSINAIILKFGILDDPVDWLGQASTAWAVLILTGVFVSVPFTSYVLLAGIQAVPKDIYEAARIDGTGPVSRWLLITRPLTRNATLVAVVLNIVNIFNSFPVIWLITQGGPVRQTDTTITYMYKLAFRTQSIGEAAALSVANIMVLFILVAIYLRFQMKDREGIL